MADVCAVCLEAVDKGACAFPECGHRFHTVCLLNCAQYAVRCPVCRHVPGGVVSPDVSSPVASSPVVWVHAVRDEDEAHDEAHDEARREWRRYADRRRRVLRDHPRLGTAYDELRRVRDDLTREARSVERRYDDVCRHAWRHDDVLVAGRRALARLRRRERVLVRRLSSAFEPLLGPEP